MRHTGVTLSPVVVPYPKYTFEYVSAGGNSSQRTVIELNTPTIDELIATMSQKIKWRKSAEGQRALMTAKLREQIKIRDDYTCQHCSVSVEKEPHLLLEIDHIVPVSREAYPQRRTYKHCVGDATEANRIKFLNLEPPAQIHDLAKP